MTKVKKTLEAGKKYGHLEALYEAPRGRHGERRFICRCDCGHIGNFIVYPVLNGKTRHCRKCAPHSGGYPEPDLVGKTLNGWSIINKENKVRTSNGWIYYFRCQCLRCGNESVLNAGQIYNSKSSRCGKCGPMYHFRIYGDSAFGKLPDGTEFVIDADDIQRVNDFYWSDEDGYVVSSEGLRMHRFILGITDKNTIVDHVNRNKRDNRKSNLRIATAFGNAANHSKSSGDKTGYIGVYFSRSNQLYEVKVGYNNRRIRLGSSKDDLILLAQMYNIAAEYFFGDYVGELNDVPPPAPELVEKILWKCKKYKEASVTATGAFTMEEKFEDRNDRKKAAGFHAETGKIQSPQRPEARRSGLRKNQTQSA